MESGMVTGTIKNTETGEISPMDHYLFCHGYKLKTIVKVINVENWTHDDNSMQISADCLGLDGLGFVFEINLQFQSQKLQNKMIRIIEDLKVDDIFIVSGTYAIIWAKDEKSITIYDPEYAPASLHFPEEEIREVFRRNSKRLEDIAEESDKE